MKYSSIFLVICIFFFSLACSLASKALQPGLETSTSMLPEVKITSANVNQVTSVPSNTETNQPPSNTNGTSTYPWRAFPVNVRETPGKGRDYQNGWKYLNVDFGIVRLGNSKEGIEDFENAITAMSLVNDAGFIYQPEVLHLLGGKFADYWDLIALNGPDVRSYGCTSCWWPEVGFMYRAWIGPDLTTTQVNNDFVASPLDFPQSPMHLVFRVPEISKSYTLTIPDGTAVEPGQFQLSVDGNLPKQEYPFKDMESQNVLSLQDQIVFKTGILKILDVNTTKNELDLKYSFVNSSAGLEASGGAHAILMDDKGFAYDTVDRDAGGIGIKWEAGPGTTAEGLARFPLPASSKGLWLVLSGFYKGTDGLYYDDNMKIVTLPAGNATDVPENQNSPTSTDMNTSIPSDISVNVNDKPKGDFLQINANGNLYEIGPVEKGAYIVGPNNKFLIYCTNSGYVYAAKIGDKNLRLIGNVKSFSIIKNGEAPQLEFQFLGNNPFSVQINEIIMNQNQTISIPNYITTSN